LDRSLTKKKDEESKEDAVSLRSSDPKGEDSGKISNLEVNFGGNDLYVHSIVTMMVDFVSLHDARVTKVKKNYEDELH
jgi:hypothetical protein